jgi:hypothetical protein
MHLRRNATGALTMLSLLRALFISALAMTPCGSIQPANAFEPEPGVSEQSFFHEALSGRYGLLEDDFDDLYPKTTRYAFLKEDMEPLRFFSRPDGAEFAIINLQWKQGRLAVNDFRTVAGDVKEQRGLFRPLQPFAYRLFSRTEQPVHEGRFSVPARLHYDYLDEETGRMAGGMLMRDETDFVVKVPLRDKTAHRIVFYRLRNLQEPFLLKRSLATAGAVAEKEQEIPIGEIEF